VFLHLWRNRPFLVALSASVLTISLTRVYAKLRVFAHRFLFKKGGYLREVLRYDLKHLLKGGASSRSLNGRNACVS